MAPGFIETEMTAQLPDATWPLCKPDSAWAVGQPDVAAAVCFLASDAARYITGQVLVAMVVWHVIVAPLPDGQ